MDPNQNPQTPPTPTQTPQPSPTPTSTPSDPQSQLPVNQQPQSSTSPSTPGAQSAPAKSTNGSKTLWIAVGVVVVLAILVFLLLKK